MYFLYPNILWWLLLLSIPLIIHFFNFRRYTTVYFSNITFLQNIKKDTKSRSKLKNILILLSRMLILAFLITAFAHPYIPKDTTNTNRNVTNTIIYIDNSFSMEAEGKTGVLLESAKVKAKKIAEKSILNTRYMLITNNLKQQHKRFVDKEQFIEWVTQIKSTHIVRTQNEILNYITKTINSADSNINYNVFVLSDFQRNTIANNNIAVKNNVNIIAIPFKSQTTQNLYIDSVWFETIGHYKGKQEKLHIKVKNVTKGLFVDVPIKLFINDTLKTSRIFNIKKELEKEIVIPFTLWDTGYFKANITINDYPITFDNSLYFNFMIKDKNSVLIIKDKRDFTPFEALYKNDDNINSKTIDYKSIRYNELKKYQVIIINELIDISSGLINEIYSYINNGGTLIFIPNVNGNVRTYNKLLHSLNSVSFGEYIQQDGQVTNVDVNDLIFKSVFKSNLSNAKLPNYKGFFNIVINQNSNITTIFKTEYGTPLFLRGVSGKGQYYVSGISFNKEYSNFITHPFFVPLFYNIPLYSSQYSTSYFTIKPNTYCELPRRNKSIESLYITENTTNKKIKPKYRLTMQNLLIYPQSDKLTAGTYSLYSNNNFQDYISFNFDRTESMMKYYKSKEIKKLYKTLFDKEIEIAKFNDNKIIEKLIKEANGKPLSSLFLWGVVVFLLMETLLLRFLK